MTNGDSVGGRGKESREEKGRGRRGQIGQSLKVTDVWIPEQRLIFLVIRKKFSGMDRRQKDESKQMENFKKKSEIFPAGGLSVLTKETRLSNEKKEVRAHFSFL